MLKKTLTMAFCLGLTSTCAIASHNPLSEEATSVVSVAAPAQNKPSVMELEIENMREPHRSKLKDWKKNCEVMSNYLAFTLGELNVKAKAKFAGDQATYDQARLDIALADRIRSFEALLEELNHLVHQSIVQCLGNSHAAPLSPAEREMVTNQLDPVYKTFKSFSEKFLKTVIYDVWGRTNKLQDYISDTYKTILESEARQEFCALDDVQKRILNENLKVSRSLYEKYKQYSDVELAAIRLPDLWHELYISIVTH